MSRKPNPYNQVLSTLQELHRQYPNYPIGRHIAMALADYGDFWGIPDKEFLFALEKYKTELEINVVPEKELEQIIREGESLDPKTFFDEEEEEDFL